MRAFLQASDTKTSGEAKNGYTTEIPSVRGHLFLLDIFQLIHAT